ncbi:MAG: HEAT repeat domain-containing protein [Marinicellaceae bacterium]
MEDDKKQKGSLITRFIHRFKSSKFRNDFNTPKKREINPKDYSIQELIGLAGHWDGFKREKAVVWLGGIGAKESIPILISRCNDWVDIVRTAAKKALLKIATSNNAKAFVEVLPDLYHLQHCGRENHDALIKAIEKFLLSENNKHHLIDGIENENLKLSKLCFSLVLDNKILGNNELLSVGLKNDNVSIRLKCFELINKLDKESRDKSLSIAIKDKFMPVRKGALYHLIQDGIPDDLLKPYLFDKHSSIREIAIKNLQHLNLKNIYVDELKSESIFRVCCSIWGLGALRDIDSINKIEELLSSPFPSIRRNCLSTITRLKGLDAENIVLKSLVDESPKVAKEASRLAAKINIILSADELLKLYETSHHYHSLISCASILKRMNKWERLIFSLNLLDNDNSIESIELKQIQNEIYFWNSDFNRVLNQPTIKQIRTIKTLYEKHSDKLNKKSNDIIQFSLKTYANN